MPKHIYINYSLRDQTIAHAICQYLEEAGFRCWIAPRDIRAGHEWAKAILNGIEESAAFVLVLSPESNQSIFLRREIALAVDRNIPIIPVMVAPVELTGSLAFQLGSLQSLALTQDRLKDGLEAIARAVAPLMPSATVHPAISRGSTQAQASKGYVFISYNREDRDFVVQLREILKRRRYAYWDYSESERDYHNALYRELEEKIENAAAFMCVVTDSWRNSEWPAAEYIYAREAKVPVFVIQAKHLARPVPIILNQQTRIDMAFDFAKGAVILEHELDKKDL